jgi:hypothetical protein
VLLAIFVLVVVVVVVVVVVLAGRCGQEAVVDCCCCLRWSGGLPAQTALGTGPSLQGLQLQQLLVLPPHC